MVFAETVEVFGFDAAEAADIGVVLEVGELDLAGERVRLEALDVSVVGDAVLVSEELDGGKDFVRETGGTEVVEGDIRILDDIVKDGGDALGVGVHARHDAQGWRT
jgi:hypothetical protein